MPNFCIRRSRAARRSPTVSMLSMRIDPVSGSSNPRMHLTRTDLPVPEPPMTTRLSPVAQSMSRPSRTRLRPNDFVSPRTEIFGNEASVMTNRPSSREEGLGDHVIEDENQHRSRDNGIGRRPADPLRPAARVIAVIAPHQSHDKAEHGSLDQTGDDVDGLEVLLRAGSDRPPG